MSMELMKIYRIVGGSARKVFDMQCDVGRAANKAREEFFELHQARGFVHDGILPGRPIPPVEYTPIGWRRITDEKGIVYYSPDKRTPQGRMHDLAIQRIKANLVAALSGSPYFEGKTEVTEPGPVGMVTIYAVAGFADKECKIPIVTIRKDCEAKPIDGLEPMKLWEYYKHKDM